MTDRMERLLKYCAKERVRLHSCGRPGDPKAPKGSWQNSATSDPVGMRRILNRAQSRGNFVGGVVPEGLIVLDLDSHEGKENGVENFKELVSAEYQPENYKGPKFRTPSGGYHLYFKTPLDGSLNGIGTSSGRLPGGIDVRSGGKGYVIVYGKGYDASNLDAEIEELPRAVCDLLKKQTPASPPAPSAPVGEYDDLDDLGPADDVPLDKENSPSRVTGKLSNDELSKLLACIDTEDYRGKHDDWLALMFACHCITGGTGLEVFRNWCMRDRKYAADQERIIYRWSTVEDDKPGGITERSLFEWFPEGTPAGDCLREISARHDAFAAERRADLEFQAEPEQPTEGDIPGLTRTRNGAAATNEANIIKVFRHDPMFRDALGYDTRSNQPCLMKASPFGGNGPFPREIREEDIARAVVYFMDVYGMSVRASQLAGLIPAVCQDPDHAIQFEPFRKYLEGLEWDGRPRLDKLLTDVAGVDSSRYARAVFLKFLLSAAARTLVPGSKVDTMIILCGPQGLGKSTFLRSLVPAPRFFTDHLPPIGDKDARAQLHGPVIVEVAELEAFSKAETTAIKSFLTAPVDRYRPPYERAPRDFPRTCVFAGTTNADVFLRDPTGARRFWPVKVKRKIDIDRVVRERDQLWAEAAHRYRAGEIWWFDDGEEKLQAEVAENFRERNAWEDRIAEYLRRPCDAFPNNRRLWTTTAEILEHALEVPPGQQDRRKQMEVAAALAALKWGRERRSTQNGRTWVYVPPPDWTFNFHAGVLSHFSELDCPAEPEFLQ